MLGKGALAVVESQEVGGSEMNGGGDVEDVERAVAALRGSLVGIDQRQPQHGIHFEGQ